MEDQKQNIDTQNTLYRGKTIRTYTGQYVDVFDPKPETITLIDLGIGQAYENRWSNQNRVHYSVAQHACMVHDMLPDWMQRQSIFHDSSEGILGDLARPIKKCMPEFEKIENQLMEVIAKKYRFDWPKYPEVDLVDKAFMSLEHAAFMLSKNPSIMEPWTAEKALFEWLRRAINSLDSHPNIDDKTLPEILENTSIQKL